MVEALLIFLLCTLALLPVAFIVIGIYRLHKPNGLIFFIVGCTFILSVILDWLSEYIAQLICRLLYSLGITASFHDTAVLTVALLIPSIFGCYKLFCWLRDRKSSSYTEFAGHFLKSIEDSRYPSCKDDILFYIKTIVDNTSKEKLPNKLPEAVKLAVFDYSFDSLGASRYRDLFGELNKHGMQMLHICYAVNDHLRDQQIISERTHGENKAAIQQQSKSFYS